MQRRDFIRALAGAASLWPLVARAQQSDEVRRIGVLLNTPPDDPESQTSVAAFKEALQQFGWSEGHNLRIDYRGAANNAEQMQAFAKELVALQPHVILTRSTPVTAAFLKQTRTIPIVFTVVSDPVGEHFVESLARPGGNTTGFTNVESSLTGKRWGCSKRSRLVSSASHSYSIRIYSRWWLVLYEPNQSRCTKIRGSANSCAGPRCR